MSGKDDGADYEVDLPGSPAPAREVPGIASSPVDRCAVCGIARRSHDPSPHAWSGRAGDPEGEDADLLADLPPMPPKPEGPKAAADDPGQPRAAADGEDSEPPDLESLYRMAQGIMPEHDQMIETMAAIHARWRKAWRETGEFSDAESFELARIIVAGMTGAIRSLD
jgi:hypothetical protein